MVAGRSRPEPNNPEPGIADGYPAAPFEETVEMLARTLVSAAVAMTLTGVAAPRASAQTYADRPINLELRGTAMLPTFDIADAANLGFGGGAGIGYRVTDKFRVMADFDLGIHGTDVTDFTINTYHYMGKVGFDAVDNEKLLLTVNLGAGAVTFGGDLPSSSTYFAINAGAKLAIKVSPMFDLLISPQGDIAFADEAELGTTNAWVWPLAVGFRVKL